MNALFTVARIVAERSVHQDNDGITTPSKIFPGRAEIIYGSIASILIFGLLYKFAGPAVKKGLAGRTERIQKELDSAAADTAAAATESGDIRKAKGDIGAERDRLIAEADAQATALLVDGRARLDAELAELKARAAADIETAKNRGVDELRAEIARLSSAAADRAVAESVDGAIQQDLIESFIQKVGAST